MTIFVAYNPMLKMISLLAMVVSHYYATTPPVPPPPAEEKVCSGHAKFFEAAVPWLRYATTVSSRFREWELLDRNICETYCIIQGLVVGSIISEVAVIATLAYPSMVSVPPTVYHTICPSTSRSISGMQSITPMFAWGVLLAVCGSAIRTWCYSILGRLFTYEVALRPGHTLIRRPPYTIVRHPSYTGFFLHFIGIAIVYFSPGGWIRECSVMRTSVGSFVIVWLVLVAYVFVCMWKRGALEDQLLQDAFGPEWDQYAHDVPWKFCPWIV